MGSDVRPERVQRRSYDAGFTDGVDETLNQLESRSLRAPDGCYRGPMPDELVAWIARVRQQLERG